MQEVCSMGDAAAVLGRLKQVLDPNGILAPGRYDATELPEYSKNTNAAVTSRQLRRS
jgi:hypothetical protein